MNQTKSFTCLIYSLLLASSLYAQQEKNIEYKFAETDSSYSFYGTIKIKANPKCLLEICFKYKHIKALATEAKDVILVKEGKNWNRLSYTYQKFIYFENTSVWQRILNEENLRVEFYMLSSKNNQKVMPKMISSSGYYQLKPMGEYTLVEYHQECMLTKEIITKLQDRLTAIEL